MPSRAERQCRLSTRLALPTTNVRFSRTCNGIQVLVVTVANLPGREPLSAATSNS